MCVLFSGNESGYKYFCSHSFSLKELKGFTRWKILLIKKKKKKIYRKVSWVENKYLTEEKNRLIGPLRELEQ